MSVRRKGSKYYLAFRWKGYRMDTTTPVKTEAEAKKIENAVKIAFRINRFDHLDPVSLDVVMRIFQNKRWDLPPELTTLEPQRELTLLTAIEDYLKTAQRNRSQRNLYAIDRLVEFFGESTRLKEIKVANVRQYRQQRQQDVGNGTINRELSVMSGILRVQIELENIEYNPCSGMRRLPENQRDTYLSWKDFTRLLEHSWWIRSIIVMLYYTGMRLNEISDLRWEMFKPERRMLVLPPKMTKEGKSEKKLKLRSKRIPLRKEPLDLLDSLRKKLGDKLIHVTGPIFTYQGRYKNHGKTHQGKPISWGMIKKAWKLALEGSGLEGLQLKDLRHTWKTNAHRSKIDPTTRNVICGHSSRRAVEDLYINLSDGELLKAVDSMTFDHGWTQLDTVAHPESIVPGNKSDAKMTPFPQQKKKAMLVT
ncbi:MAG: site-specific integrase [Deltaproteobacteria bacterium]|nr:site-specific integrase [Deltaproteobacteria bacterium]